MWNSWCPAIRMPSNRPNRTRPRTVIAMSQTNCVSLIYMLVEFVYHSILSFINYYHVSIYLVVHSLGKASPNAASFLVIVKIRYVVMQMITFLLLQIRIEPEQLIQACAEYVHRKRGWKWLWLLAGWEKLTATERKQHQRVDEEKLDDIDYHAAQWDLQRPQMRIYREYMDQFHERKYHASRKHTLG